MHSNDFRREDYSRRPAKTASRRFRIPQGHQHVVWRWGYQFVPGKRCHTKHGGNTLRGGTYVVACGMYANPENKFCWQASGVRYSGLEDFKKHYGLSPLVGVPTDRRLVQGNLTPTLGLLYSSSNMTENNAFSLLPYYEPLPHGGTIWGILVKFPLHSTESLEYLGIVPRRYQTAEAVIDAFRP